MRVAAAQFGPTGHAEHNLEVIQRLVEQAATQGARLVVLPEEAMVAPRHRSALQGSTDEVIGQAWEPFNHRISKLAQEFGITVVAGGYEPARGDKAYNTVVAYGPDGELLTSYRKLHLYDAFNNRESDTITPGDGGLALFDVDGFTCGILTCYDIRFPEVARALTLRGADALLIPAAWYAGEHKVDHWATFTKARALENTVWVVATDTIGADTVGHSVIVDPLGVPVAQAGSEAEICILADLSHQRISEVRHIVPVLENRRTDVPELFQPLTPGDNQAS